MYTEDCQVSKPVKKDCGLLNPECMPNAYDEEKEEERLWRIGCEMIDVEDDI